MLGKPPKPALSSYVYFVMDSRERIAAENPDARFADIGRLLRAAWNALSDEEKQPYVEQAAKDQARAEEEMKAYTRSV